MFFEDEYKLLPGYVDAEHYVHVVFAVCRREKPDQRTLTSAKCLMI